MAAATGSQPNVKVFDERMKEVEGLSPAGPDNEAAQKERKQAFKTFYKPPKATTAKLPNGEIPLLGLGTWKSEPGEVAAAVVAAIRAGYRHIDCAAVYGNEHEVGEALKQVLSEGVVSRSELHITSKLWNTEHSPERVEPALRKTLADLQLEYLDLYLIHWPSSLKPGPEVVPPYIDTWRAMESLVDKGLVKNIGVSNLSIKKLEEVVRQARIKPAVNQVEAHPYWNNNKLVQWCQANGVHLTAYSPLGSPDSAAMMGRGEDVPSPMKDPVVCEIASRLGKSPAQVLLRWGVQRGTSVLAKSTKPERIEANLDVFSWSLTEQDMQRLSSRTPQVRMVPGTFLVNDAGPYRKLSDLWDEENEQQGAPMDDKKATQQQDKAQQ